MNIYNNLQPKGKCRFFDYKDVYKMALHIIKKYNIPLQVIDKNSSANSDDVIVHFQKR